MRFVYHLATIIITTSLLIPTASAQDEENSSYETIPEYRGKPADRMRLAIGQGIHGLVLGSELCVYLDIDGEKCTPLPLLMGAAGAVTSTLATQRHGIASDHVAAINGGSGFGWANGFFALGMAGLHDSPDHSEQNLSLSVLMLSSTLGTLGGHFLYRYSNPRPGTVESGVVWGTWSTIITSLFLSASHDLLDDDSSRIRQWGGLMLAMDAGLILGGYLGRLSPMSYARANIIHGSSSVGMLLGMLIGLGRYEDLDESSARRSMAIGTAIGFSAGWLATLQLSSQSGSSRQVSWSFTPQQGGLLVHASSYF